MGVLSRLPLFVAAGTALAAPSGGGKVVTYFLKQPNAQRIIERALDVSDPASDNYGEFLSFEEVVELQRPSAGHVDQLNAHLDRVGAYDRKVTLAADKVVATLPEHVDARLSPELGEVLDGIVQSSGFLHKAPERRPTRAVRARSAASTADDPQSCLSPMNDNANGVTPECFRKAYGVGDLTASHPKNSQAVIVNEGFNPSDLDSFLSAHHLNSQPIVKSVNGEPGSPGDEGTLDVEYITAMGSGTPTWWVYIDGHADNPFASWLTYMSNSSDIPLVQSLSVGAPEDQVGEDLTARMNVEIAALGARGTTVLFASGDSGYQPAQKFGAASPFVTAVGGIWRGEMGNDDFLSTDELSTGGFSSLNANPIQAWQEKAVAAYLKTKGERPQNFNSSRRCVPDLAAFDDSIEILENGGSKSLSGTSCSTPVVAGMMSLINDAVLQAGHSPLGFVNPLLYANEDVFMDVVHGDNRGFAAVPGYDPASGLGTFGVDTFTKLKARAVKAKADAAARRAAKAAKTEIIV